MKIKNLITLIILVIPIMGKSHAYRTSTSQSKSSGSIHSVRPYLNKKGTYYRTHLSGNPQSGMHCQNNICN